MSFKYDKNTLKENLSTEEAFNLISKLAVNQLWVTGYSSPAPFVMAEAREDFMKIINKNEFKKLIEEYPDGGIVFAEYAPDIASNSIMVTDGNFGATDVAPHHGEVFDWDWNIEEYKEKDWFIIFDNNDVLQMIKTLTSGLKIKLKDFYEYF